MRYLVVRSSALVCAVAVLAWSSVSAMMVSPVVKGGRGAASARAARALRYGSPSTSRGIGVVPALNLSLKNSLPPAVPAPRTASASPLRIVLAGPPGSGKTTIARRLAEEYGMVPISVGGLLREYAKNDEAVAETMRRGDLVDARLVLGLVKSRLSAADVKERGFILDGFPRRLGEAKVLSEFFDGSGGVDAVIDLDVPEAELKRRILARGRPDDTEKTFANRMKVYRRETVPAVALLAETVSSLTPAVAEADKEISFLRVKELLDRLLGGLGAR